MGWARVVAPSISGANRLIYGGRFRASSKLGEASRCLAPAFIFAARNPRKSNRLKEKRGTPRDRPPVPTEHGRLQDPSAIDNVGTYVCAARIMEKGAAWLGRYGAEQSTGAKLISVSGDCARPDVYEAPFGITINALLELVGAPDTAFVQMSGPPVGPSRQGNLPGASPMRTFRLADRP